MIELNLLPEELKIKAKKTDLLPQAQYLLYLIALFFGIAILMNIYLGINYLAKINKLNALNNKWKKLEPQRQMLKGLGGGEEGLPPEVRAMQQFTAKNILWSEKLNKLSLNLPSGVWLTELYVASNKNLILRGSVVSLQKEEMALINKFIENLKKDRGFFKDFANLELTSVQKATLGGYEVVNFVLNGVLK